MSQYQPPKLPLRLFKFYCSNERLEELEGDLYEVYNEFIEEKGTRFAKLFYWWLVMRSFRSYALKRTKMKNNTSSRFLFLRHNLKVARRNLLKNKTTLAINVLGLTIGIATFIAIFSIVLFELSFNTRIPDKEKIFRVYTSFDDFIMGGVANPTGPYMEENFSGLKEVASFHMLSSRVEIPVNDKPKDFGRLRSLLLAGPSYFKLIDQYEWLAGSLTTSLNDPQKVVLTNHQAKKYFGNENWSEHLGREIIYLDSLRVFVSGIVKQPDFNSDFQFTDFISLSTVEHTWLKSYQNYRYDHSSKNWGMFSSSSQLWVKLDENVSPETIRSQLDELDQYVANQRSNNDQKVKHGLQPLTKLHFDTRMAIFNSGPTNYRTLRILGAIAFAILFIAIFNFINLQTAQSTTKFKEVGVRKVMGGVKTQLIGRFLTESTLISLVSVLWAIPLAHFGLIYFKEFLPNAVDLPYSSPVFWIGLLLFGTIVGVVSGIYPSFILSSFHPIRLFRPGSYFNISRGKNMRRLLIFFQFLFSQLLIFGTLVIYHQISFMLDKELGFEKEGIMYFDTPYFESPQKLQLMVTQMAEMPEISEYFQGSEPIELGYSTMILKYQSSDEIIKEVHTKSGDINFLEFYDIELIAGRNLTPVDSFPELLINETLTKELGLEKPIDAIGISVSLRGMDHRIVGVIKDFHFQSLHNQIEPMAYYYESNSPWISFKVGKSDIIPVVNKLTDKWNELYPDEAFNPGFMDEIIEAFYEKERKTSKLSSFATVIAILISCLGLLGLVSFTIVQKTKELGIRKVLGASFYHVTTILSKEFVLIVVIAFIISLPISYYLTSKMMENYAYQAEIYWWIYALGGLASAIIAIASIGVKIWKASDANPIESLRYE